MPVREIFCAPSAAEGKFLDLAEEQFELGVRRLARESRGSSIALLDLGGFPGRWGERCARSFPMLDVYVYDRLFAREAPLRVRARERGKLRPLELGEAALPHADASVSFCSMLFFSSRLSDEMLSTLLNELRRTMRPGALLAVGEKLPGADECPVDLRSDETRIASASWFGESVPVFHRGRGVQERTFSLHGFLPLSHIDVTSKTLEAAAPYARLSLFSREGGSDA